jgi:sugar phosphate isomerase/epimerase
VTTSQRIIWSPTVGFGLAPEQYIDATLAAGADAVSLSPDGVFRMSTDERARIVGMAVDAGLTIASLDGVYSWLPLEGKLAQQAAPVDDILTAAEAIGARYVNALAVKTKLNVDEHAERFAILCDRAAEFGRGVHLEFSPIGGVADVAMAWDIVRGADRPNGGILFDTWHFYRGTGDVQALRNVPGDRVFAVQISDAGPELHGTLWNDTLHHRLLPGDGCFPLHEVMAVLAETGALALYGPEVISDAQHALGPREAARTSMASVETLVTEVVATA